MLRRGTIILATALLVTGCARHYVQIAEGLSSPTSAEGIRIAPRQFTTRQLIDACREAVPIERLEVIPSTLELTQGNVYALGTLTVVAVNSADVAMPNVPIVIEAEDTPVLRLASDDPDLDQGRLRVVGPGTFRMRIRTTCGNDAEATIEGRVPELPQPGATPRAGRGRAGTGGAPGGAR